MEWNRQSIRGLLIVVCSGVVLYTGLHHLSAVAGAFKRLLDVLAPFLLGGAVAFVLNVPMRAIERHMPAGGKMRGLRRPLSLVMTLVCVALVLILASQIIAPGIAEAVASITAQIPNALERLRAYLVEMEAYLPMVEEWLAELNLDWASLSEKLVDIGQRWGKQMVSSGGAFIGDVVSGLTTFVIGLIFAFYLLVQKENLARQGRQVLYALLPERVADPALQVLRLANKTFSSFLSGQCLEAVILGALFMVAMSIFKMPYALLVGVLIAFTALIPIVGGFIGCAVGALLIAVSNPMQALWFVVMFLIIQQIEGNLIYPHVVGNSVGLPSIWVLAAVTVGGKLMGVAGMLLFIPLCSVAYAIFRGYVKTKLEEKKIAPEKWKDPQ